jgi:hypothetical protein
MDFRTKNNTTENENVIKISCNFFFVIRNIFDKSSALNSLVDAIQKRDWRKKILFVTCGMDCFRFVVRYELPFGGTRTPTELATMI